MSVINQMLKDLDERQVEQNAPPGSTTMAGVNSSKSNKTTIAVVILLVLIANVLGWYVWDMYQENKTLKANVESNAAPSDMSNTQPTLLIANKGSSLSSTNTSDTNGNNTVDITDSISNKSNVENIEKPFEGKLVTEKLPALDAAEFESQTSFESPRKPILEVNTPPEVTRIVKRTEPLNNNNTVVTPVRNEFEEIEPEIEVFEPPKQSSLSISRKKLSPEKLVKQKIEGAERAILDNNIAKAEKLFEEVLLIEPEHKSARKQLGALWYGRKLFGPAVNLLSRGVALHPTDIDFRLMKARILLNQNNATEAFNVLNGFSTAKNVEYQTLLANTAQLLKRNNSAILAYRQLVILEDYKGKWWLGLAVALDRNGEFEEAKSAYKSALTKNDLSEGSAQFIRQRLNELGE